MLISKGAFDLIVASEVTSRAYYDRKLRGAIWPGGASGVTIAIGYDVGMQTKAQLRADWSGIIPDKMIAALEGTAGVAGRPAAKLATELHGVVDVPWDAALRVHANCMVPRYVEKLRRAVPNTGKLNEDCLGALTSLVFNRGASFSKAGDRYREMRAIRSHMAAENFGEIAKELRGMKRLWPDMRGLRDRRETEAFLFERGLAATDAAPAAAGPVSLLAPSEAPPLPGPRPAAAVDRADDRDDESAPATVDAELQEVQQKLIERGYFEVGTASGIGGARTSDAIRAFRRRVGLSDTDEIDDALKAALMDPANNRPIAPERAALTANDLRERGSSTITFTDRLKKWAGVVFGGGLIGGASEGGSVVDTVTDGATKLSSFKEALNGLGIGIGAVVVLCVVGGVIWLFAHRLEQNRVHEARIGKNL